MPTISQIRAARALLGWSQGDLADRADLSQTGIARIENGTNQPNSKTLQKIKTAFDEADVEFIDDTGVRKTGGQVKVLRGPEGMRQFFNELYQIAKDVGGEICLFNGVPGELKKWLGEEWYDMHIKRMEQISDRFHYRIIVKKGEAYLPGKNYAEYKYFPEHLFTEKTIYIFGDTVFFRDLGDDGLRLIKIHQPEIAASMRILFDIAWDQVAENTP